MRAAGCELLFGHRLDAISELRLGGFDALRKQLRDLASQFLALCKLLGLVFHCQILLTVIRLGMSGRRLALGKTG